MMKKILMMALTLNSANCFAGEGSTLDFILTAQYGFNHNCAEVDRTTADKLRITACQFGASMRNAGITQQQFDKLLDTAAYTMTEFKSICN